MKILVFGSYVPSIVRFRGNLLRELKELGHELVACAPWSVEDSPYVDQLNMWGVRFIPIEFNRAAVTPLQDIRLFILLWRLFRKEKPDAVLAYTMKPVVMGSFAARCVGVQRIVPLITGLGYTFESSQTTRRILLRTIVKYLLRWGLAKAHCTIFQNADDLAFFKEAGILASEAPTRVVAGSGIDLQEFAFHPPVVSPATFVLISRLVREKGILEYIEAIRILREQHTFRAILVGASDTNPAALPADKIALLCSAVGIQFIRDIRDVRPYLRDSGVFVLPTWYREGIPRTTLEALAVGRAIITTNMPGCRETVVAGENGYLVAPQDIASLVSVMKRFITDPELACRMGKRSRDLAHRKFDVRRVNADMIAVLVG